jgi:DNA-binding transcriptional MerR regulator
VPQQAVEQMEAAAGLGAAGRQQESDIVGWVFFGFVRRLESLKSLQGQAMPNSRPPAVQGYRIGQAAEKSGVSAANIRYYETQGLIAPAGRGDNSYRLYSESDLHQLRFIRLCRAMDMSLDEVRTLLALDLRRKADCDSAREALEEHLQHVRARLAELQSLAGELEALRNGCDGSGPRCRIIEALHRRADAQALDDEARTSSVTRHV